MKVNILVVLTVLGVSSIGKIAFADVKWGLDGSIITGYDDNVTFVNTNPIRDMVTRTSVGGGLAQQGQNDAFNLKTGLTENIYSNHSSLDNLAEDLNADYKVDLNPYEHIKALETFTHSVDPSNLGNAFGRINGNYGTYYNNFDLESATNITEQWTTTVKYTQSNFSYSTSSLSDSALYNPELSAEYDFSSKSRATLNYDYRRRSFSPGQSADANTPSAGWRQYLNSKLYVDLLTGVDFIKGFGESLVKPRYAAGLTQDLDQNTQLTLKYDKQYETDSYTQDIFNDWHLVLNAYHEFTARISGDVAVFTGQGKYIGTGISDKYIGTSVDVKYAINDHTDFSVTYSLQDNDSNSSIRASTQNTVFAGVTVKL